MPPRTRSTTTTAPAGRRPKVAGLRAPGRRGVTGESGPASTGEVDADRDDPAVGGTSADTAVAGPETTTPAVEHDGPGTPEAGPDAPAAQAPAVGTAASGASAPSEVSEPSEVSDVRDGGAARPTPKRRTGRTMTPSAPAAETASRRGGTAVLERPTPVRTGGAAAPQEAGPSRAGRLAAALTRPVASLGGNPRRLITVLVVVLVLSLGLGTWAFVAARADRAEGTPYANAAVVDVGATAEVVGQTRQAMEQILSYDFTKLDDSVNAARSQATGTFASEYLSVFEQTIRKPATDQKLRQTATVLNIGVQQLTADRATVLALVQFTAERTTNGQTTNAPGLLAVQVVKSDGRWKISELNPV